MSRTTQIPPIIVYSEPEVRRSIKDGVNQSNKFSKFYRALTKPAPKDRYVYMPYSNTSIGAPAPGYPSTKEYRQEDASFLSNIGLLASLVPNPISKAMSLALQIPDALYDTEAVARNSKDWRNWVHLVLDGLQGYVTKTKTPFDDVLSVGGFVDDAAGSQGIDLLEDVEPTYTLPLVTIYGNKKK